MNNHIKNLWIFAFLSACKFLCLMYTNILLKAMSPWNCYNILQLQSAMFTNGKASVTTCNLFVKKNEAKAFKMGSFVCLEILYVAWNTENCLSPGQTKSTPVLHLFCTKRAYYETYRNNVHLLRALDSVEFTSFS